MGGVRTARRGAAGADGVGAGDPPAPSRGLILLGAVVAAAASAALVTVLGGAVSNVGVPGLARPDTMVTWLVPTLRLARDVLAVLTVGCLLAAAFFTPGGGPARCWLRIAALGAAGWALVTAVALPVTLANLLPGAVSARALTHFATAIDQGRALLVVLILTVAVAVGSWQARTTGSAALLLLAALAAVVPPAFVGHAAGAGNHQQAVSALLLHVVAAALWAGGLVALVLARRWPVVAAERFSRLALWCFVAVAVSGILSAVIRVPSIGQLATTAYGRVVLLKVCALVVLGAFGWWHRRRSMALLRLAVVEVVIFGAAVGLAAGLAGTPPPPVPVGDLATELLGFGMPGPATARALVTHWYPDVFFLAVAIVAVGCYLAAVRRLARRGVAWPWHRTGLWLAGWALVVFVTSSGLARYGAVSFSAHMMQHMTLNMLAPILLVLGAPITLALRALRPSRVPGLRGPREWLTVVLHSRLLWFLTHPLVALALYVTGLYAMYFSGLYELALRSHAAHLAMFTHFLLVGSLFFWLLIGTDPAPRRLPYPARMLVLFVSMAFHAIFGLAIMQSSELLAPDWYAALAQAGSPVTDPLADQRAGGGLAWGFGELPSLVVLFALVAQWARSEEREGRRFDRIVDRAVAAGRPEDDPHEQYNAYLRRLSQGEGVARP